MFYNKLIILLEDNNGTFQLKFLLDFHINIMRKLPQNTFYFFRRIQDQYGIFAGSVHNLDHPTLDQSDRLELRAYDSGARPSIRRLEYCQSAKAS